MRYEIKKTIWIWWLSWIWLIPRVSIIMISSRLLSVSMLWSGSLLTVISLLSSWLLSLTSWFLIVCSKLRPLSLVVMFWSNMLSSSCWNILSLPFWILKRYILSFVERMIPYVNSFILSFLILWMLSIHLNRCIYSSINSSWSIFLLFPLWLYFDMFFLHSFIMKRRFLKLF